MTFARSEGNIMERQLADLAEKLIQTWWQTLMWFLLPEEISREKISLPKYLRSARSPVFRKHLECVAVRGHAPGARFFVLFVKSRGLACLLSDSCSIALFLSYIFQTWFISSRLRTNTIYVLRYSLPTVLYILIKSQSCVTIKGGTP